MATTIKFKTDKATDWYVTKEFADDKHMRNFIAYVCRTKKGYTLDEVFINQIELNSREDMRNYTYNILTNEIVIFEQEKEDENTFNCVGDIVIQLKKEGYKQVINILKN